MLSALAISMAWGMFAASRDLFPANIIRDAVGSKREASAARFIAAQSEIQRIYGRKGGIIIAGDSLSSDIPWGEIYPNVSSSAIRGSTTADIVARLPTIRERNPRRTIYLIGINDIDNGVRMEETMANYQRIINGTPGQIVFVGLLPCGASLSKCRRLTPLAALLNGELRRLTSERVKYVAPPALSEQDTYDGLHLNARGVAKLQRSLSPFLT